MSTTEQIESALQAMLESGERIGSVGVFGPTEWSMEPQIHVEVISEKNLFEDQRPGTTRDWFLVEGDLDNNSLINIDKVIKIIRGSSDTQEADQKLRKAFGLSEKQSDAILNMRLAKLTGLEIEKLEAELKEVLDTIKDLMAILKASM